MDGAGSEAGQQQVAKQAKVDLIESARVFDVEQATRAKEFQAQVDRVMGRAPRVLDPIDAAWLRARTEPWKGSCLIPMASYPWMLFPGGVVPDSFVPLARRFAIVQDKYQLKL